jgi:cyclopropane-fatty-acyl-phospholipid synthase
MESLFDQLSPGARKDFFDIGISKRYRSSKKIHERSGRLQTFSDAAAAALLRNLFTDLVRRGRLTIILPSDSLTFGSGAPSVAIRVPNSTVIWRIFLNPDLGFGEAYMDGAVIIESGTIYDLLDLCLSNIGWTRGHWLRSIQRSLQRMLMHIRHNTVNKARANAEHHYDLSQQLYDLFLDEQRQYSCAYFISPGDSLEQAQRQKMRHLSAKMLLAPGQRVLDIGSGWGSLAFYLARSEAVDVTGITLSTEQYEHSRQQAREYGLADKVRFHLRDYREIDGVYDRIVSVGMFEHVGINHYREYFQTIRNRLADGGVALVHTIGALGGPGASNPWIEKYIFPGGYSPALSEIVPHIEKAGLCITDIEVLRLHYAETLRNWRLRFMHNPASKEIYDERFRRMWEFYLAGSEAAFRHSGLVVFQIQLSKRLDTVPWTRDYIGRWENEHRRFPHFDGQADNEFLLRPKRRHRARGN